MKLVSIIGTRPNFIKEHLIARYAKDYGIDEIIINTGQHYDFNMADIFFEGFTIKPKYNLNIGSKSHGKQTAEMIEKIESILLTEKPEATLVYGDVNSTLAGALASSKCRIPVIHFEGGIRTGLNFNPEEINRRVTDVVSELIFCVTKTDKQNLIKENFSKEKIVFSGDLHKDLLELTLKEYNIIIKDDGYVACTIHRSETTDNIENLKMIVDVLVNSEKTFKIPLHPRTKKILKELNLYSILESAPNVNLLNPLSYIEFIKLLSSSTMVLTDSGGVRREAFLLKKPVINFSNIIWFREILDAGYKTVAYYEKERVEDALNNFKPDPAKYYDIFGNGNAHKVILKEIAERFS